MDIFNKKKIKKLENEIDEYKKEYIKLENDLQRINNQLLREKNTSDIVQRENEKLSKWIQGIIKVIGTMEVRDIQQIHIPIVKYERNYKNPNAEMFREKNVETIIIPEIRFSKSVFY